MLNSQKLEERSRNVGDFDAAVEALSPLATPMEVQGLFCGVYCVSKATPAQAHWHEMLRTHFGDEAPLVDAVDAIAGAQGQALADENLSFQLWLPDDEAPLGDRADGLARFCGAFLSGYGLSGGQLRCRGPGSHGGSRGHRSAVRSAR